MIIGIAGNIGAGKGTVTEYIVQKYGAQHMRYSHILEDILKRLSLPYNRQNNALLAEALRHTFGGAVLSRALGADAAESAAPVIVFEGIRKKDELEHLRTLPDFIFLFVDAPIEVRHKRLTQRNEKTDDHTKTFEDFQKDHEKPADKDVPLLKESADYIVDNAHSLEEMHSQVDRIMQELNAKT